MENFKGIFLLNSCVQNETIAWYCLEHSEIGRFKQLLQDGMPLTVFMLTTMVFFGYSNDAIKEVLKQVRKYEQDVLKWMQSYYTPEELTEVLPVYQDQLPKDWPSNEYCVQYMMWQTLCDREEYDLVAQNNPEFLLKKDLMTSAKTGSKVWTSLLRVDFAKYAPLCLEQKFYSAFLAGDDWWKYLVDNGRAKWLLRCGDLSGLLPREEIVEYCLQKGLYDELYEEKCFDELLAHNAFDVFVKNHSLYGKFLRGYPDKVDWEGLWAHYTDDFKRGIIKEQAWKNKNEPKCYDFLLAHTGFFKQLLLFL